MTPFQAFILGLVQGVTEFVPVSSSGHLVLAPWALNWPAPGLAFDTMAHWGTLFAVLVYFWRDWRSIGKGFIAGFQTRGPWSTQPGGRLADPNTRLAWWLVVGTIPTAILGLAFQDFFKRLFENPSAVGVFLLITALILTVTERLAQRKLTLSGLRWVDAMLIGLAQAAALAPGISRSGATIATGMMRGLNRDTAARFSFLLGTPAIFGAGLIQLTTLLRTDSLLTQMPILATGFFASAVSGYICIRFLLSYLRQGRLYIFAGYCAVIGLAAILFARLV